MIFAGATIGLISFNEAIGYSQLTASAGRSYTTTYFYIGINGGPNGDSKVRIKGERSTTSTTLSHYNSTQTTWTSTIHSGTNNHNISIGTSTHKTQLTNWGKGDNYNIHEIHLKFTMPAGYTYSSMTYDEPDIDAVFRFCRFSDGDDVYNQSTYFAHACKDTSRNMYVLANGQKIGARTNSNLIRYYDSAMTVTLVKKPCLTVSYNTNGGTASTSVYTNNDSGTILRNGSTYTENKSTTSSTAVWNSNYGLANASSFGLTREGYKFLGWGTSPTTNDYLGEDDTTVTFYDINYNISNGCCSQTLYAIWEGNSYTVSFIPNGGTIPIDSKTVTYNSPYGELPTPTFEGYTFTGWYKEKSGGTPVKSTDIYTTLGDSLLYARYRLNKYYIQYNANGGQGSMEDSILTYNVSEILNANRFTRNGYTFKGWSTNPNATTATYTDEEEIVNLTANDGEVVTLYAVWEAQTFLVRLNPNGGTSGTLSTISVKYGSNDYYSSTQIIPSRTGYKFLGFYTATSGGTKVYDSNGVGVTGNNFWDENNNWIYAGNISLYAQWEQDSYYIIYDGNDNESGSVPTQMATFGEAINLQTNNFVKKGYHFIGWNTASNGSGTSYSAGQSVTNITTGETITLYAQWELNTYNVVYDGNGSTSGTTPQQSVKYNETATIQANGYKRTGYAFSGWNTKADGSGDSYSVGTSFVNLATGDGENFTLYAQWTKGAYTISYDVNGGFNAPYEQIYYYNSGEKISTKIPGRVGYTFTGWKVANSTTIIQSGSSIPTGYEDFTLYAQWTPKKYSLTIDPNGGSYNGATEKTTSTVDYASLITTSTPTKANYEFAGWKVIGKNVNINNSSFTMPDGDVTLRAQWTPTKFYDRFMWDDSVDELSSNVDLGIEREGYTFLGWTKELFRKFEGEKEYVPSETDKVAQDLKADLAYGDQEMTVYAYWQPNAYSITYDLGGATDPKNPSSYTPEDETFTLKNPTHPFDGYTFIGWTGSNGDTPEMTVTIPKGSYGNKHYVANWQLSYTIKYNANGGNGTMSDSSFIVNSDSTLSPNKFTREYYEFQGWSTTADGNVEYKDQASVKDIKANAGDVINLYAVWKPQNFTNNIIHWMNGFERGEGNNADKTALQLGTTSFTKPYNSKFILDGSKAVEIPNGFELSKNFKTSSIENTLKEYPLGTEITQPSKNMEFEYNYNPITYNITYELDGGTNSPNNPSTYNVLYGFELEDATKPGYEFLGWYIKDNSEIDNHFVDAGEYVEFEGFTRIEGVNIGKNATFTSIDDLYSQLASRTTGDLTIVAKWSARYYGIKFHGNGHTSGEQYPYNQLVAYDEETSLLPNIYTKDGYLFTGWNTEPDGSGTSYKDKQIIKNLITPTGYITKYIDLYAQWTNNTSTITWNPNGGSTPEPDSELRPIGEEIGELPTTEREGYDFDGWYTDPENGEEITEKTLVPDEDTTYYAHWTPHTYEIAYHANGINVKGTMVNSIHVYDEEKALSENAYRKEGYVFKGWATSEDGDVEYTDKQTVLNLTSENGKVIDLYAVWSPVKYTIVYDKGTTSGTVTGTTPSTNHTYNVASNLSNNGFDRTGYSFVKWNTKPDGTGTSYVEGQTVLNLTNEDGAVITLYAIWTPDRYTYDIIYKSESGKELGEDKVTDYFENTQEIVPPDFPGYKTPDSKDIIWDEKEKTIEFIYELIPYKITVNPNGGTYDNSTNNTIITYNVESADIIIDEAERTGYKFLGWTGSNGLIAQNPIVIPTGSIGDKHYIANWEPIQYTIEFNPNTGDGYMDSINVKYDEEKELPENTFIKEGYSFAGWSTTEDGNVEYKDKDTVLNLTDIDEAVITLYAVWTPNEYTYDVIHQSTSGKVLETGTITGTFGSTKYVDPLEFIGYISPEESEEVVFDSVERKTIILEYTPIEYIVNIDCAGGDGVDEFTYTIESEDITIGIPNREHFTFTGWTGGCVDGTDEITEPQITVTIPTGSVGDREYIAHWTPNKYKLIFDVQGGFFNDEIIEEYIDGINPYHNLIEYNDIYGYMPEPVKDGFTFLGWYDVPGNDSGIAIGNLVPEETVMGGEDVTVYAQWKPVEIPEEPTNTPPKLTAPVIDERADDNEIPPFITEDNKLVIQEGDKFTPLSYVTAYDDQDGDLTDKVIVKSSNVPMNGDKANVAGTYEITYIVTDKDGASDEITITVIVNKAPVIEAPTRYVLNTKETIDDEFLLEKATSTDLEDVDLTDEIKVIKITKEDGTEIDTINPSEVGKYIITLEVTDNYKKTTVQEMILYITTDTRDYYDAYYKTYRFINSEGYGLYMTESKFENGIYRVNSEYNSLLEATLNKNRKNTEVEVISFTQKEIKQAKDLIKAEATNFNAKSIAKTFEDVFRNKFK